MLSNKRLVVTTIICVTLILYPLNSAQAATLEPINWEQKGITIRLVDETIEQVNTSLSELTETGANYVTVTPGWHTDNTTSSNVDRKDRTPSDELLAYTIEKAHAMGLKVFIKPHVDPKTGEWRAKMDPNNKAEFFKNYKAMLMHYAEMSETYDVEEFAIGSELFALSTNPNNEVYWRDIIQDIRKVYSGKLTYNANVGDTTFDESVLPFWDGLDYIGFSMYQPLAENSTPTLEEILLNWKILDKNYLEPMYRQYKKPLVFTELGYRSMDGAALDPGDYKISAKVDLEEQKLMYEALFTYWQNKPHVIGMHLWDWKVYDNPGGVNDIDYTPQNKPALEVLTQAFGGVLEGMSSTDAVDEEIIETIDTINNQDVPRILISEGLVLYEGEELAKLMSPDTYDAVEAKEGSEMYKDRDYAITGLPEDVKDSVLIQTKNSDKNSGSLSQIVIEFFDKALIYTAYDTRAVGVPTWLKDWKKLGEIVNTQDTQFTLFAKEVDKGTLELGGNKLGGETGAKSNYFAFISKFKNILNEDVSVQENQNSEGAVNPQTSVDIADIPTIPEELVEEVLGVMSENTEPENILLPENSVEIEQSDNITGNLILEYPENAAVISGERKIKVKIPDVSRDLYTAEAIVDDKITYPLEDSNADDIKQAKIEFTEWDWNGSGPYNIIVNAKDLSGNLIDTLEFKVFVKH